MNNLERMRASPLKKNYIKRFKISRQRTIMKSVEVPSEALTGMENSKDMKANVSIFTSMDYAFDTKYKNSLFIPRSKRFSLFFFFLQKHYSFMFYI